MSEQSGANGTPVAPQTQPQAGNPATAPAAGAGGQSGSAGQGSAAPDDGRQQGQPDGPEPKWYRDDIKKAKAEARAAREELDAIKTANLTASEKAAKQLADREKALLERETALQERALTVSVRTAAQALGFANPALAARLLDREQLDFDGDGNPTNVEPLLRALLKSDPYLGASRQNGIDQGARGEGSGSTLSMDDIKKMSQPEIMRRWPEVEAAMAAAGKQS